MSMKHIEPRGSVNKAHNAPAGVSPSSPQHSDSTPAPDRGGPVACLGGPAEEDRKKKREAARKKGREEGLPHVHE